MKPKLMKKLKKGGKELAELFGGNEKHLGAISRFIASILIPKSESPPPILQEKDFTRSYFPKSEENVLEGNFLIK